MPVYANAALPAFALPGLVHRTAAGPDSGVATMEVWLQTVEPGAATPVHRHDCEEAVVILSGSGRLSVEGEPDADFGPDSTLVVPRGAVHRIVNTGAGPMTLVAALGPAPVVVTTPEGQVIPLPWQA